MSALSSSMAADILQLLQDVGGSALLSRTTPGAYDEETGTTAAGTTEEWTVTATLVSYKSRELVGDMESFRSRIVTGDRKALVATPGLTTDPRTGDSLVVAGTEYKVISVQIVEVGQLPIVYILQVRHGG